MQGGSHQMYEVAPGLSRIGFVHIPRAGNAETTVNLVNCLV
jgi:hypothetical protein